MDVESLSTLEFYGKSYDDLRTESVNSLKQLWSRLNLLSSRVEKIGDSIEQLQRYSFQYNIKIIGLPESETQESASQTTSLCINLFKAAGIEISNQDIDIAHRIPTRIATSGPRPIGGQPLIQSNVTKFLGVYLDEHLTWKYHVNFVCKQIAKSIGILSRTRFYLSCKTKLTLYYTLIYPYITYCNSTWSSTYVSNLNRIYYKSGLCELLQIQNIEHILLLYSPNWKF